MVTFSYQAKSKEGKVIKGRLESKNKKEAVQQLAQMDLIVFEVEPLNDVFNKEIRVGRPLKQKDFVVFLRQFATLVEAGILLVDALELLIEETENAVLKEALENIATETKEGNSLSDGMGRYPELFPELLVQMIKTGEVSGQLQSVLQRMAAYYEKQYQLKQKVTTALTYPLTVFIFAVLITVFLLLFIVPVFGDMYASFGSELPAITRVVLNFSHAVRSYWWFLLLVVILLALVLTRLAKRESVAVYKDALILKLPIVGSFAQKTVLARMTQTLSSLLSSSVPILQAVEVTSKVVGNRVVERVLLDARTALEQGESLARPMEEHWVFPSLIIQMIRVGEQSGALDEMLKKASEIYEQEVTETTDKLQSLIEPVLIIFLAVIVGVIVLSIVIPMFGLFNEIQ